MPKYLFLSICIALFSCSGNDEVAYRVITPHGTTGGTAKATPLAGRNFGPVGEFGYLTDILLVGELIVVKDDKHQNVFHVIREEEELAFSFQELGDGPDRIDDPSFVKVTGYDQRADKLYLFSYKTKSIASLGIHKDSTITKIFNIPGNYWSEVQSAALIGDTTVALTGLFADTKFYLLDPNSGAIVVKAANNNPFEGSFSEAQLIRMSPRNIHYNDKHNLVVLQNTSLNALYVYDVSGTPRKYYSFGELNNVTSEGEFMPNYFYYYSTKTQEDIVYSLYLGVDQKRLTLQEMSVNFIDSELHLYDLISDEMRRFSLDRMVNVCVVDSGQKFVYCIDENNEDQPLVKYEIPE